GEDGRRGLAGAGPVDPDGAPRRPALGGRLDVDAGLEVACDRLALPRPHADARLEHPVARVLATDGVRPGGHAERPAVLPALAGHGDGPAGVRSEDERAGLGDALGRRLRLLAGLVHRVELRAELDRLACA